MTDFAADLLPWFQIVGTFATAFAATAAWRSSVASRTSAAHIEASAQRTAVATGLAKRPDLTVEVHSVSEGPAPFNVVVRNRSSHEAIVRAVQIERPGAAKPTITDCAEPPPASRPLRVPIRPALRRVVTGVMIVKY